MMINPRVPKHEPDSRELTPDNATVIRDEHAQGKSMRQLGREFGVPESEIKNVIERWIYGDVR